MCQPSKPYYEALPTALKPRHYDVSIKDIDFTTETFKGHVSILFDITESTSELRINYRDLTVTPEGFKGRVLVNNTETSSVNAVAIDSIKEKEVLVIKFDKEVTPAENAVFVADISYDAILQTNMAGFYKSSYTENGEEKFMGSTQFEATDARRAFPCLDEPALKATFKVSLTLDKNWTALANTPVKSEYMQDDLKTVTFETTPIMSTYLVAWAIGEFEYIESFTEEKYVDDKPMPVRIYTTKGYLQDAQLALEITPKIVDYFSRVFEVKYPLPKLDLIAVHSFSHNAMENWGLITYRSTALLFSEKKSDPAYKQKVAYVIAHELAHQWFGNLVTMQWWDELWLNEGFATWVGFYAVDYLYPEWDIFSGFVSESVQGALNLDGLRNSHPIEVPVENALDIDQLFDAISYLKGATTILMISTYLGTKTFLKGVALYLQRNKFSNATSSDLWNAISEVSGKPINSLMDSWIKKVGFPVIDVTCENGSVHVRQSRFLNSGDVTADENKTKWWVPLSATAEFAVDSFDTETAVIGDVPEGFFKLNKNTSGAYRVNYSPEVLEQHILPYITKMSSRDRVGLIADVALLAASGSTSTTTLLKLVETIIAAKELDSDYVTWLELGNRLDQVSVAFDAAGTSEKLHAFKQRVYTDKAVAIVQQLEKLAFSDDDFVQVKLRSNILSHAATLGIKEVDQYAVGLFEKWVQGESLRPSLKAFVFKCVAAQKTFSADHFAAIYKEVLQPSNVDSREIALGALGWAKNPEIIERLLTDLVNPKVVPTMDAHYLGQVLSKNSAAKDKYLDFFLANYSSFYDEMTKNMVVFERFVKTTLCNYQSAETLDRIVAFFKDRSTNGFQMGYEQTLDKIRINVAWYARDANDVAKFLTK